MKQPSQYTVHTVPSALLQFGTVCRTRALNLSKTGMEDRPWPLESNGELLWKKKKKKGKIEVLSRQKVDLFRVYIKVFNMFDSKTLHPPDDDLTEVKTQINTQSISSVKSKLCSDGFYCRNV